MNEDRLTRDCLELASLEANEAYYERLSLLVRSSRFEEVMATLELLVDQELVEYVSSKYVLTQAGHLRVVALRSGRG